MLCISVWVRCLLYWAMDKYNNVWKKGLPEKGVDRKGLILRQKKERKEEICHACFNNLDCNQLKVSLKMLEITS